MYNHKKIVHYNQRNHLDEFSHGEAFDTCTKVLINSSIAVACGPFFDRDIMHAMEICVEDVRITMNEMASKNSIALLEAQVRNILVFSPPILSKRGKNILGLLSLYIF